MFWGIKFYSKFQILVLMIIVSMECSFCFAVNDASASNIVVSDEVLFKDANQHYKNGEYKKAMDLYKKIKNKGPEVNYNLGNCAYRLGMNGYAILYWRRAEKDWPIWSRAELLENIRFLLTKLHYRKKWENKIILFFVKIKDYFISLLRAAPEVLFQLLFLFVWLLLFLFLRILYKKRQKFILLVLFIFVLLVGILLVFRYHLDLNRYGVVVTKRMVILSGPSKTFQSLSFVPEGREVIINRKYEDYFKVRFNGITGWASRDEVEKVIP